MSTLRTYYALQAALTTAFQAGKQFVAAGLTGTAASETIFIVDAAALLAGLDTVQVGTAVFKANNGAVTPNTLFYDASGDETATALSLATQINNNCLTAGLVLAVPTANAILITAVTVGTAGNSIPTIYVQNGALAGAVCPTATLLGGIDTIPVGAAYVTLAASLADASADGKSKFIIKCLTNDSPTLLRLNGNWWHAYAAGIRSGLALEEIYDYEVCLSVDGSDTVNTYISFKFHFEFGN